VWKYKKCLEIAYLIPNLCPGDTLEMGKTMFYRPHTIQANNIMCTACLKVLSELHWKLCWLLLHTYEDCTLSLIISIVTVMQINTDLDCVPCVIMMLLCDVT